MKPRRELKIAINFCDYIVLRNRLKHVLPFDRYSQNGAYLVQSLYFDTWRDKALREKLDGVNKREKFRIRMYNSNADFIRLEKKTKINGLCYKENDVLTKEQAQKILGGDILWILDDQRPLLIDLYCKMKGEGLEPKKCVEYLREAFIYEQGNVRITFDREVKSGKTDFFAENASRIAVGDDTMLMEVKFDEYIPSFIVNLLQLKSRKANAFSKYALSRIYD
jgi:hypothetical protein